MTPAETQRLAELRAMAPPQSHEDLRARDRELLKLLRQHAARLETLLEQVLAADEHGFDTDGLPLELHTAIVRALNPGTVPA